MSAQAHEEMVAAVAPYVDSAISKTVNVPAFVPGLAHGQQRQQTWPSTVAYLARLIIHRYAMLGVLDEDGYPLQEMGILQLPEPASRQTGPMAGSRCPECGNATLIHKDGCDFCTACGHIGTCG